MATGLGNVFSGGKGPGHANAYVEERGFNVVALRARNATWLRDELILALDIYLQYQGQPTSKTSTEVVELSRTLNRLGRYLGTARGDRFRNANGIYMKLMNFRRFDPAFKLVGQVGLQRGGKDEEEVWNEFARDPKRCHEVAETIRQTIESDPKGTLSAELAADGGIEEAEEGRTAMHRRHERNRELVRSKKQKVRTTTGKLECEACGFDFRESYGQRGDGFIECHHEKPVHTLKPGERTIVSDLRLVCSNCHRMIHAKRPWLSVEKVAALVRLKTRT